VVLRRGEGGSLFGGVRQVRKEGAITTEKDPGGGAEQASTVPSVSFLLRVKEKVRGG